MTITSERMAQLRSAHAYGDFRITIGEQEIDDLLRAADNLNTLLAIAEATKHDGVSFKPCAVYDRPPGDCDCWRAELLKACESIRQSR